MKYVNCGNDTSIQVDTKGTISLWVYLSADKWCYAFDKDYASVGGTVIGYHTSSKAWMVVTYNGSYNYNYFGSGDLNRWVHLVVTYDESLGSGNLKFYEDGVFIAEDSWTDGIMISSGNLHLGGKSRMWDGLIDEVRIYSTALTASEIKALYLYPAGNKGTRISGNQITTGIIQSTNWITGTSGSYIDLDNGTMILGDAAIPALEWDGTTLSIDGDLTVGSFAALPPTNPL